LAEQAPALRKAEFHCAALRNCDNSLCVVDTDKIGNISIIIPIWREMDAVIPLVHDLKSWPQVHEVIVSAAAPVSELRYQVEQAGAVYLNGSDPTRGQQLNRGAQIATNSFPVRNSGAASALLVLRG